MSQDRQFFDTFMLVLGILIGIAVGIAVLARFMAADTQAVFVKEDPRVAELVAERIRPIGRVIVTGAAEIEAEPVTLTPEPVATVMTGPQVYNAACGTCHAAGVGGAPVTGDQAVWAPRIAQGDEILRDHVINGYQGEVGYMPPKGGRLDLSDEEILDALAFMIEESS